MLQLIHIYSVPTNDILALPVSKSVAEGQPSSLSLIIASELHIDRSDQELLTPTGTVADSSVDLSCYCINQVSISVYTNFLLI